MYAYFVVYSYVLYKYIYIIIHRVAQNISDNFPIVNVYYLDNVFSCVMHFLLCLFSHRESQY